MHSTLENNIYYGYIEHHDQQMTLKYLSALLQIPEESY